MNNLIEKINALRDVPDSSLNLLVRKVAVILTSSRSGSSLIKGILDAHPDIASFDGEIEPFLTLSRNGFGYNSDSDAIETLSNKNELVNNILDGLTTHAKELPSLDVLKKRWEKRILLQFPELFFGNMGHEKLTRSLNDAMSEIDAHDIRKEKESQALVLNKIFRDESWRIDYYDGYGTSDTDRFFDEFKIEEPPFIAPKLFRKSFTANDAVTKTLLFKTPSDAYRIGMYEQLFPNAEIKYIHLTRGYAQSVNGLMDGWLSSRGFFSHNLKKAGVSLNIGGYSDAVRFGKDWWKFDLPPNWRAFVTEKLENVCLNQWVSAHRAILQSGLPNFRISFETILSEPSRAIKNITDYLGLPEIKLQSILPVVMATETPKLKRWRKRESQMLKMGKNKEVKELMNLLGYEMNPETWL